MKLIIANRLEDFNIKNKTSLCGWLQESDGNHPYSSNIAPLERKFPVGIVCVSPQEAELVISLRREINTCISREYHGCLRGNGG